MGVAGTILLEQGAGISSGQSQEKERLAEEQ